MSSTDGVNVLLTDAQVHCLFRRRSCSGLWFSLALPVWWGCRRCRAKTFILQNHCSIETIVYPYTHYTFLFGLGNQGCLSPRLLWPIEPSALGSVLIVNHGRQSTTTPTTYCLKSGRADRSTLVRIRTPSQSYLRFPLRLPLGVCYE